MFSSNTSSSGGGASDPQFNYVTMLLHGDGTNGAQNNTFLDSSTNNFTITRNGNTTQGTFSPYGSNWSNYFDGSGDYLTAPDNAALEPGSSDLTWEMWINTTNSTQYATLYSRTTNIFATGMWSLMMNVASSTAGDVALYVGDYSTGSPLLQTSGVNVRDGAWHHIAVVRNGSAWTIYIDGVSRATQTWSGTIADISGGPYIGRDQYYGRDYTGYISNLRVLKGTAVYTAAFTPSTSPLTAITNTSLLTCQSNRFIDASSNNFTITRNGDVSVQRFSPFSPTASYTAATIGGSGYFDGTGDYLTSSPNAAWSFGTGAYTVEFWLYILTAPYSSRGPVVVRTDFSGGPSGLHMVVGYQSSAGSTLVLAYNGLGNIVLDSGVPAKVGQWMHVAIVRTGTGSNQAAIFIDGVRAVLGTDSFDWNSSGNGTLGVGGGTTATSLDGYLTDLRLVKGSAVYSPSSTTITVPTAPLASITNTSVLLNFTNAGIIDNAMMNDLETVGNAQISTSVSKFGSGSLAFDGTGDSLVAPFSQNVAFGTGDFTVECWFYASGTSASLLVDLRDGNGLNYNNPAIFWSWTGYSSKVSAYLNDDFRISSGTLSTSTWYHVALVRVGTTATLYINGSSQGTYTYSTSVLGSKTTVGNFYGGGYSFNGYIDDLRISKYARYTANFTPPADPFPDQ